MSDVAMKVPISQRINWRIVGFALVIGALVGYPAYLYLETELSGGIRQRGEYTEVNLKAMSTFAFDRVAGRLEDIPQQWRDLDGKKVILEGEMYVTNTFGPMTDQFDLVYSISQCCFSGPQQVQHFVKARPVNGPVPNMHYSRVRATGVLHVNVIREEGQISSVYQLDVHEIEPIM